MTSHYFHCHPGYYIRTYLKLYADYTQTIDQSNAIVTDFLPTKKKIRTDSLPKLQLLPVTVHIKSTVCYVLDWSKSSFLFILFVTVIWTGYSYLVLHKHLVERHSVFIHRKGAYLSSLNVHYITFEHFNRMHAVPLVPALLLKRKCVPRSVDEPYGGKTRCSVTHN